MFRVDKPGSVAFCGLYFGVCRTVLWYHVRSMVGPYCYQCAPSPQPAILTIANAYAVGRRTPRQGNAEGGGEMQKSGKQKAERGGQGEKLKG